MLKSFLASAALATCGVVGAASYAAADTVSGTATYLERMAVIPGSVLEVKLVDVSRADAPAITMSSQRMSLKRVPQPFELTYDATLIDERMRYNIEASVTFKGKLLFRNTSAHPVLTQGNGNTVEVVMQKVSTPAKETPDFDGTTWEAFELGGRMLVSDIKPVVTFAEGGVGVYAGCNRFRGPVEVGPETMSFKGPMAGTLMACPAPYDKLEKTVLKELEKVTGYVMNEESLALTNKNGVTVMRLAKQK
ncbi:META domain protein [Shimia thalassica]|uniref:META domain protein n=1 Tax=Shimia thalassica TaxID=1715693 RepID=A0A0P1IPW3_9RHOB|nr:YbaY family lipoprotein [Shimia thalassica]CUK11817.1 META domain protein [Shimia thalassica]